jgi:hypothetical protein
LVICFERADGCLDSYGGSPVDALVTGLLGATLKYLNLRVAKQNPAYGNIFECVAPLA